MVLAAGSASGGDEEFALVLYFFRIHNHRNSDFAYLLFKGTKKGSHFQTPAAVDPPAKTVLI
jgi:hypothetical protein